MLRCPIFRTDIFTAVKARSIDLFIQSIHKLGTDCSPCRPVDVFYVQDWVFLLVMLIPLAFVCLALFCYLTGQPASGVHSGLDGEVRNTNELLQGKDEVLHDKAGL